MMGLGKGGLLLKYGYFWYLCWVVPCPATVTTRIIMFNRGNICKPSFASVTGRGDSPISMLNFCGAKWFITRVDNQLVYDRGMII